MRQVGDPVTLWGEGLPAERVAPYADTIAYELVCGISQRVAVEWKKGEKAAVALKRCRRLTSRT